MIDNKLTVIIPTLAAPDTPITNRLLEELEKAQSVKEVMIIDNTQNGEFAKKYTLNSKCRIIEQLPNLYVNAAWEFGVSITTTPYYLLLNDDILGRSHVFDKVVECLNDNEDINLTTVQTQVQYGNNSLLSSLDSQTPASLEHSMMTYGAGGPKAGWFLAGRTEKWIPLPVIGYYPYTLQGIEFPPSFKWSDPEDNEFVATFKDKSVAVTFITKQKDKDNRKVEFNRELPLSDLNVGKIWNHGESGPVTESAETNVLHVGVMIRALIEQLKIQGFTVPLYENPSPLDRIMGGDDFILWANQMLGYKGYALITSELLYHAESSTVHARRFMQQLGDWVKPSPISEVLDKAGLSPDDM